MFKIFFKRKPKTKITFQDFYNAVEKVKEETGASHFVIYLEQSARSRNVTLKAYLDNPPRFETGLTIEEVCDKLRNNKVEEVSPIKEIII